MDIPTLDRRVTDAIDAEPGREYQGTGVLNRAGRFGSSTSPDALGDSHAWSAEAPVGHDAGDTMRDRARRIANTRTELRLPELGVVGFTRGLLGAGLALLLAGRLTERERQAVGGVLLGIGVATSVPLAMLVMQRRKASTSS